MFRVCESKLSVAYRDWCDLGLRIIYEDQRSLWFGVINAQSHRAKGSRGSDSWCCSIGSSVYQTKTNPKVKVLMENNYQVHILVPSARSKSLGAPVGVFTTQDAAIIALIRYTKLGYDYTMSRRVIRAV